MDAMWNMDRSEDPKEILWEDRALAAPMRWLILLDVLFFAIVLFGGGYIYQQRAMASSLALQNQVVHSTVEQMSNEIDTLNAKRDQTPVPAQSSANSISKPVSTLSPISSPYSTSTTPSTAANSSPMK